MFLLNLSMPVIDKGATKLSCAVLAVLLAFGFNLAKESSGRTKHRL